MISIDIDEELSELRILISEKQNFIDKYKGVMELYDIRNLKEYDVIYDKECIIEEKIREKIANSLNNLCVNKDFENALALVHNSFKDVNTSQKSLFLRKIYILSKQ